MYNFSCTELKFFKLFDKLAARTRDYDGVHPTLLKVVHIQNFQFFSVLKRFYTNVNRYESDLFANMLDRISFTKVFFYENSLIRKNLLLFESVITFSNTAVQSKYSLFTMC